MNKPAFKIPSLATLAYAFGEGKAVVIRAIFESQREEGCKVPDLTEVAPVLYSYGVEFRIKNGNAIEWITLGDAYGTTIVCHNGRLKVTSWGEVWESC